MNNLLRVGFKVKVVNENRVEYNEVGTIVRIASNSIEKFYVVDFVGKSYVYFEEEELVPYADEEVMEVHSIELEEEQEILETKEEEEEEEEKLTPPEIIYEEGIVEEEIIIEPIVILEEDERVICVNTNEIYKNNKVASEMTNISADAIKRCCNGSIKYAGKDKEGNKLVWKFVKNL